MTISKEKSIYYDDVNLLAQNCIVESRKDIPKELNRIVVSPMTSVAGSTLIRESINLGLTSCVHRFQNVAEQIEMAHSVHGHSNLFYSIGLNDYDRIQTLIDKGISNFLIDVANGYMIHQIRETVRFISKKGTLKKLMVGNVHTKEGYDKLAYLYKFLDNADKVYVRVGIGNGGQCLTKDLTGYNRGQITEISDTSKHNNAFCVADGAIRSSGQAMKAFGAGANFCMMGSFFAQAEEAECHVKGHKKLFGGASKFQAKLLGKEQTHHEGRESDVCGEIMPLAALCERLWGGIASGVSYGGYESLTDFISEGVFELKI